MLGKHQRSDSQLEALTWCVCEKRMLAYLHHQIHAASVVMKN